MLRKKITSDHNLTIVAESQIPTKDLLESARQQNLADLYNTCQGLRELCEKEHGIGISAVQAGVPWKLFLVKGDGSNPLIKAGEFAYFADCEYEPLNAERVVSLEGCLSLRSSDGRVRTFNVERCNEIRVTGYRIDFDSPNENTLIEINVDIKYNEQGIVFQHEIDHHNGILISDIGKEVVIWQ